MAVIREKRQFQVGQIGVARASEGGRIIGQAISQSADQFADMFYRQSLQTAETAGTEAGQSVEAQKIMTINPETGKPEAYEALSSFGPVAAQAYQRVVERRFQQSMDEEMQNKARELAVKYEARPNGVGLYETAMADYIASMSNAAEGKFKTYIADVGTSYLNATRSNLAIAQVRRERAAAAAAQREAVETALESAEGLIAQGGAAALSGSTLTNGILQSASVTVRDGEQAGLFDAGTLSQLRESQQLAIARGFLRNAVSNTTDPDIQRQIQAHIGTQGAVPLPAGYEDLKKSIDVMGSNYSALSKLEQFSDGLFADSIQYAESVRRSEIAEQERMMAVSIFDMQTNTIAASSASRSMAQDPNFSVGSIVQGAASQYNSVTASIRQATANGQTDIAASLEQSRSTRLAATVEGLRLRALDGLASNEIDQLELSVQTRNASLAPASARESVQALIALDSNLDPTILQESLPFFGSWADGAGQAIEAANQAAASNAAAQLQPNILQIDRLGAADIDAAATAAAQAIAGIENLSDGERKSYRNEIADRSASAYVTNFFNGQPSEEAMREASVLLEGGAVAAGVLSQSQIDFINNAKAYSDESGNDSGLRTHFNSLREASRERNAEQALRIERAENVNRLYAGQLDGSTKAARDIQDEIIEQSFPSAFVGGIVDWGNPQNLSNPNFVGVLNHIAKTNVMPESLQNAFTNFANGDFRSGDPSTLLSHWSNLRQYDYKGQAIRSPALNGISQPDEAMLNYLADSAFISSSSGAELSEVFRIKSEYENNPRFKENADAFFGGSVETYVINIEGMENASLSQINGMTSAALNLYSVSRAEGLSNRQIRRQMELQLERTYPSGDGIVVGMNGSDRTAFPLSIAASGNVDEFKSFVLDRVTQANPNLSDAVIGSGPAVALTASAVLGQPLPYPQIVLVPLSNSSTGGQISYSVYRSVDGQREPVFETIDGNPVQIVVSNRDERFVRKVTDTNNAIRIDAQLRFNTPTGLPSASVSFGAGFLEAPEMIGLN
jgi:hypothetical protein